MFDVWRFDNLGICYSLSGFALIARDTLKNAARERERYPGGDRSLRVEALRERFMRGYY